MSQLTVESIVQRVHDNFVEPPDADYSPYDYGHEVAETLPDEQHGDIVRRCYETLSGTLAESFLDGFLERAQVSSLDILLLDRIATAVTHGSGAGIVRLLQRFGGLDNQQIADAILDRIATSRVPAEQDRLAYALWALMCGETYHVETDVTMRNENVSARGRISEILNKADLPSYSRSALNECLEKCPG